MKRIFLSAFLMLAMMATANAGRIYIFHDDFAKPLEEGDVKVQYDEIWSWDEPDNGGINIGSAADEGVLPGSMYTEYTFKHGWGGGDWVFKEGNNIDFSAVTEEDVFVMYFKTNQPAKGGDGKASVFSLTVRGAEGSEAAIDLGALVTNRDYTWNRIEIPVYELMDKGWKAGIASGNPLRLLSALANCTDGGVKFAFDEMYFTAGGSKEEAVENVTDVVKATKVIENGQVVIIKNGVRFNALGAQL